MASPIYFLSVVSNFTAYSKHKAASVNRFYLKSRAPLRKYASGLVVTLRIYSSKSYKALTLSPIFRYNFALLSIAFSLVFSQAIARVST